MKRAALLFVCLSFAFLPDALAQGKRPMTIDDMFRFQRITDPQISPDGKLVAYVVTAVDLKRNSTNPDIWLTSTVNGATRQLTNSPKSDRHPRWSPDGRRILFESNRSGDNQLWVINIDGGEAHQLTTVATEAANAIWSPDGNWIAFTSAVYPEYSNKPFAESNALNKQRIDDVAKSPVKAKVFKRLFFRHWDSYVDDKRQHLFVMPLPTSLGGAGTTPGGQAGGKIDFSPRDVTPGDRDAYPTSMTFSNGDDFTFSPDGRYLVYTAPPEKDEAWSTNYDLWRVPLEGGNPECLTRDNPAADNGPRFSPNGRYLIHRAQRRPGAEADRWELMLTEVDRSGLPKTRPRSVSAGFDSSPESIVWQPDSQRLFFSAEEKGMSPIFSVDINGNNVEQAVAGGTNGTLSISREGILAFARMAMHHPPEVYTFNSRSRGSETQLTDVNGGLRKQLDMPRPEAVSVRGAGGTPMHMWILKPPGFTPSQKWPLVYLVHGGPQGAWEDGWSYRWNPQAWAAQGYVVALPNPRGSTGFGQQYIDEISGDWGGKCYEDLMAGVAHLEKQPYIDRNRMAAAGASFGGYMVNWFQGHTTKFKTLITHCGVYNFDSMYALTDELWFDEWEHGGPPWANRESYEKHSPHRFAKNFRTPMLIIHNDLDFRVPVSEGHQLFTTLQRLGVPSKMINFPDEGHWVLKPANSAYWHREVFGWLAKYVPPGAR